LGEGTQFLVTLPITKAQGNEEEDKQQTDIKP
jgi:hypothetical protein